MFFMSLGGGSLQMAGRGARQALQADLSGEGPATMASFKSPRTDFGTVLLHWLFVAALAVAAATGLRIAADDLDLAFLTVLDPILPSNNLFFNHVASGLVIVAVMAAYAVYVVRTGLTRRFRLDQSRLAGLKAGGRNRWAALNALLIWGLFAALMVLAVTGAWLYLGGGSTLMRLHLQATWVVLAFPLLHVAIHFAIGGAPQLLRIVMPTAKLPTPPPSLADLLSEHLAANENKADPLPPTQQQEQPPPLPPAAPAPSLTCEPSSTLPTLAELASRRRAARSGRLNAHPLATALAAGIGLIMAGGLVEQSTRSRLVVHRIDRSEAPRLDGDLSDPAWSKTPPVTVMTQHGANLGGSGQSNVEIRALHDGTHAYLAFVWDDPSRSLKHLPLIKSQGGWYRAGDGHERADEITFHDDQFSVLLLDADANIIGAAIHLAGGSIDGLPPATSGRGLHYTPPGLIADVWLWKASRGGLIGNMDNGHFSGPKTLTRDQVEGQRHYSGGYGADDGTAMAVENIAEGTPYHMRGRVEPLRLPSNVAATERAMGRVDPDPNHSEPEGSVWWLTTETSAPYSPARDAEIPDGTVIPGVVITGPPGGGRGEIEAAAKWASGRWTLEVKRKLDTGRPQDVPIRNGVRMWVAAFDHAETRHTWHLRPFRLEIEE